MMTLEEFNTCGEELEKLLSLKTSPIAIKMLEKETDIPEGAIRPKRDLGTHLAQCQAFALSRRDKKTVAMLKEDNWCFAPLMAYGLVDKPDISDFPLFKEFPQTIEFPRFERGKYIGIVSAPLKTAKFQPDIVSIYCNTAQLRSLLLPSYYIGKTSRIEYQFFPPDCSYTIVPVLQTGQYIVAPPDPGNYIRAMAGDDEMILSVRADKMKGLIAGQRGLEERNAGHNSHNYMMPGNFSRPEFYQEFFKYWGLDVETKKEK